LNRPRDAQLVTEKVPDSPANQRVLVIFLETTAVPKKAVKDPDNPENRTGSGRSKESRARNRFFWSSMLVLRAVSPGGRDGEDEDIWTVPAAPILGSSIRAKMKFSRYQFGLS
jgi:hypothetical protein